MPLGLNDSVEYWSGPYMYDLLAILGISGTNVVGEMLEDMYFYDWQIGSQEDMTPGIVDVRNIYNFYSSWPIANIIFSLEVVSC